MATPADWFGPGRIPIRDVNLFVDVVEHGYPVVLMHGGRGWITGRSSRSGVVQTGSPWCSTTTGALGEQGSLRPGGAEAPGCEDVRIFPGDRGRSTQASPGLRPCETGPEGVQPDD